ncbi:DUF418 domain-containing protein [Acidobacteriia bacterium AH_259_A11_L15]|nr:DUF418 domain-containing protein [Acidobacteriia bacterium AH_259_A11_L15]
MPVQESAPAPALGPVRPKERIETIDILRGFALLGVILVNTWAFQSWSLPWRIGYAEVWTGTANHIAMWMIEFFASGRFFRLFSFLFGLGFALQLGRAEQRGMPFFSVYRRRLLVLLLFGLLHGMLRGTGDILHAYAVLGFFLLLFRKFSPRALLVTALVCLMTPWAVNAVRARPYYDSLTAPQASEQTLQEDKRDEEMRRARREEIVRVRREGTLGDNVAYNLQSFAWDYSSPNPLDYLGYVGEEFVMFLLGLYAGRRRIFENMHAHLPFIRKLLWWELGLGLVGIPVHLTLTLVLPDPPPLPYFAHRAAQLFRAVGAPAFSLFYASAIVLLVQRETWKRLLAPLGAVGRMPLTNYLLHTVIHAAIFFGVGLGLYAKIPPAATVGVTLLMYGSMILLSVWWMGRFPFGPAEWLWRTLTYGKLQPMRVSP